MPSSEIPFSFKNFVQQAIDKYNRRSNISAVEVRKSAHVWTNADGDKFNYNVNLGDVRRLGNILEKEVYTLAVADIPYGFNAPGSEYDEVPFSEQDVLEMVQSFSAVTTSEIWRFVVIHSLQQANCVMSALGKVCNAGVEAGIWEKPNINGLPSGNRLAWGFENWTIGYWSKSGLRQREMYNFGVDESRINIVRSSCVTKKSLSALGGVVNPYQKPVALGAWFVEHFSEEGDWVADLCCGTESTLVAALLKGRHGTAVDKSDKQVEFVVSRIMTLDSKWSLAEEAVESGEGLQGQEVQPPVGGSISMLSTLSVQVEVEEEEENPSPAPSDIGSEEKSVAEDLNDMLLD